MDAGKRSKGITKGVDIMPKGLWNKLMVTEKLMGRRLQDGEQEKGAKSGPVLRLESRMSCA